MNRIAPNIPAILLRPGAFGGIGAEGLKVDFSFGCLRVTALAVAVLICGDAVTLCADPAAATGATVPWTTYQADLGTTTGETLTSRTYGEIANEAIQHTCVRLAATGQYITWKVTKPANAMVIRACVPDAPDGGVASHTLTVAVNGKAQQKVTLSSLHSWLYG